jgi:hypothetical protein
VKHHFAIQVRIQSWAIAAACLLAFCWLGFAAVRFGSIYQGLEVNLPLASRFAFEYGPVAFPLFGVIAAAALILSEVRFRKGWLQWALVLLFALLIVWALRALLIGGVFMGPASRAMASPVDAEIPFLVHIAQPQLTATDSHSSA